MFVIVERCKLKILFVTNMYPVTGSHNSYYGVHVKEQIDGLVDHLGCESEVYVIPGYKGSWWYFLSSFYLIWKVYFGNYNVIHVHYGISGMFLLGVFSTRILNRIVVTLHGGDILVEQGNHLQVYLTKKIVKKAGYVITLSEEMNDIVSKLNANYECIPCGVDSDLFCSEESRVRNKVVVFPGNKERMEKNYPYFKSIVDQCNLGVSKFEIVELDGFTRDGVREILINSELLLMTSVSEGSPQVVKEAMLCDLAVVSTNVGDVSWLLGSTPGTAILSNDVSLSEAVSTVERVICESKINIGVRRQRALELGVDSSSVTLRISALYKKVSSV